MSRGTVLPKVYAVIRDEERDGDNGMHRTIARIKFQRDVYRVLSFVLAALLVGAIGAWWIL